MATSAISDASFETDVLKASVPVLVDFWAEWCGPCKMIAPALEELSAELGGKVAIAKLNIDENPMTPQKYGVRGIPTLLLFKDGEVAATKVGAIAKGQLKEWIENSLS
ncbi:thioredoxin TrxA [Kiloniella laminariae]|uniref:Thioredoxin n=1 Tax=Kiloniella laminariae TaxID=454162 RepID=A0ABT4LJU3_9PROT|nr:thioredoxin TrxA [Kiloniella laminariae]MCZ4281380.1 thioredoxin TrxA [Kiloniella laminariae]